MKALITGARGTVGSVLCRVVEDAGGQAVAWDRGEATPGDGDAAEALIDRLSPSVIFHLAMPSKPTGAENEGWLVNQKWTADLASIAHERGIPCVYASTVMVFSSRATGPFTPEMEPDEHEGYGQSKRLGELAALEASPTVRIARLGWQIGDAPGSNNMIDYLERQQAERGHITASNRWLPATSFLDDTARGLIAVAGLAPGVYHIGSNLEWNFHQIVTALNKVHGGKWTVHETDDFVYDQRLIDERVGMPPLELRLPLRD